MTCFNAISDYVSNSIYKPSEKAPVPENKNVAHFWATDCSIITKIVLSVLVILSCLAIGIGLTVAGSITTNPLMLECGISVLVGTIGGTILGIARHWCDTGSLV